MAIMELKEEPVQETQVVDEPLVYIVDDELPLRSALARSLGKRGYAVETFESAEEFLTKYRAGLIACLVLDIRMDGMSGTELQEHLMAKNVILPIIFVTGHGDIAMSVRAMKSGAVDFLEKPYPIEALIERIEEALKKCKSQREDADYRQQLAMRYESLTPRETDVMTLLVAGAANASNKTIAKDLDISHRTVDDHRARIMSKMKARSLPELVEMSKICGVHQSELS